MTRRNFPPPKKGSKIVIIGGVYVDHEAWVDDARSCTRTLIPIIVKIVLPNGNSYERQTAIQHDNYELETDREKANCYEEAVFIQHSDN